MSRGFRPKRSECSEPLSSCHGSRYHLKDGFQFHLPGLEINENEELKKKCKTKVSEYEQVGSICHVLGSHW